MANSYMKECSTSLIVSEMQVKATISYQLIPVKMTIIKKVKYNFVKDVEE